MEDRREWIVAQVRSISASLGLETAPEVKFIQGRFGGPVEIAALEFEGSKVVRRMDVPELHVAPSAVEALSEREMTYRLTHALISHEGSRNLAWVQKAGFIAFSVPALTFVAILIVAYRYGGQWFAAFPLVFLVIPIGLALGAPVFRMRWRDNHLAAIDLTGDAVTAMAVLRSEKRTKPKWVPGPIWRRSLMRDDRVTAMVAKEAIKRGYRLEALPDV